MHRKSAEQPLTPPKHPIWGDHPIDTVKKILYHKNPESIADSFKKHWEKETSSWNYF